ncbi:MAG: DUF742 domain-containing protein [Actinomycetes bacterium]
MLSVAAVGAGDPGPIVRPYAWTRGRTRPKVDLAVETLVTATSRGAAGEHALVPEKAAVVRCCHQPRSVAEIAATLEVPLGVARVLLSDMASENLVAVHAAPQDDERTHLALLERVLRGLRKL